MFSRQALFKYIDISLNMSSKLPVAYIDSSIYVSIMSHLLSNAIKFSEKNS